MPCTQATLLAYLIQPVRVEHFHFQISGKQMLSTSWDTKRFWQTDLSNCSEPLSRHPMAAAFTALIKSGSVCLLTSVRLIQGVHKTAPYSVRGTGAADRDHVPLQNWIPPIIWLCPDMPANAVDLLQGAQADLLRDAGSKQNLIQVFACLWCTYSMKNCNYVLSKYKESKIFKKSWQQITGK